MAEEQLLSPLDDYLKVGLHIGTKVRSKDMAPFIYKVRPDGLAVLNVEKINERIKIATKILINYNKEDILIVCRRENGWKSVKMFSELTGIRAFTGRYPPGILTNPKLKDFLEIKLLFVCDPFPSKNIIEDAAKIGIPVMALCDSNDNLKNVDFAVPCNNKGKKSLGLLFWILAKGYLKEKGIIKEASEMKYKLEDFTAEE